ITLGGSFTDPGTLDQHTVTITWGDGSAPETFNLAAGILTFSKGHKYLDNSPKGSASGVDTISVTVKDDDTGTGSGSTGITVNIVAPASRVVLTSVSSLNENDSLSLSGSFTDPGTLDKHSVTVDWGDGSAPDT